MHSYIATQSTYATFEIALFTDKQLIDKVTEDKRNTSKLFIPLLENLLSRNAIAFSELSFCAVNCGPAPFSTLRSIIASMNGLHCATNIPLIGIDGLQAIFLEFYNPQYENTVILLNAFNNESYYLIAQGERVVSVGYKKTQLLHGEIQQFAVNTVNLIDNRMCSLETIGRMGYEKFIAQESSAGYIAPLHLKTMQYK